MLEPVHQEGMALAVERSNIEEEDDEEDYYDTLNED
jgi:hypothetical protein